MKSLLVQNYVSVANISQKKDPVMDQPDIPARKIVARGAMT